MAKRKTKTKAKTGKKRSSRRKKNTPFRLDLNCQGMNRKDKQRTIDMFSGMIEVLLERGRIPLEIIPSLEAYIDARLNQVRDAVVMEWTPQQYREIQEMGSTIYQFGQMVPGGEAKLVFPYSHAISASGTIFTPRLFSTLDLQLADASTGLRGDLGEFWEKNQEAILMKLAVGLMMAFLSLVFGHLAKKLKDKLARRIKKLWEDSAGANSAIPALKAFLLEIADHIKKYGAKGLDPSGESLISKISKALGIFAKVFDEVFDDFDWDGIPFNAWDLLGFLIELGIAFTPWGWLKKAATFLAFILPLIMQLFGHAEEVESEGDPGQGEGDGNSESSGN